MAINYPGDCGSPRRKMEYLYRAQELLRKLHNVFVTWRETGLTQAQYDELPNKIRQNYPYVAQIDMATWKKFHDEEFLPRSDEINEDILQYRAALKQSTQWNIDVGDIPKFQTKNSLKAD